MSNPFTMESTLWVVSLMAILGVVGYIRGVRAEGVTLTGLVTTTIILTNDSLREQMVSTLNEISKFFGTLFDPKGAAAGQGAKNSLGFLQTADQKLFFYVVLFALGVIAFYVLGNVLKDTHGSTIGRSTSAVLGGLSGFVISLALTSFSQSYLSRHPNYTVKIELPTIISPALPGTNTLAQYGPFVFLAGFLVIGLLAAVSLVKSIKARR